MFDLLDRVFPIEQCLTEDSMLLAENVTGKDPVHFFKVYGPIVYGFGLGSHTHTESPFTITYSDVQLQRINYEALGKFSLEMSELRQKLLGQ